MKIFHDDVWNITRNRYAESLDIFWPLAQHFDVETLHGRYNETYLSKIFHWIFEYNTEIQNANLF